MFITGVPTARKGHNAQVPLHPELHDSGPLPRWPSRISALRPLSAIRHPFDTTNMTRPSTATKAPIRLRMDGPCFYQRQLDQGQHPPKPRTTFIRFSLHIRSGPRSSRRPVLAPNPYLRACILWEVMRKTPSRPPVRSMVALEPAVSGRTEKIGYVPSNIGPVRTLVNTLVTRTCLSDP